MLFASATMLPSSAMSIIFAYFDAADLARMAQVSKPWKTLVYRTSVWESKIWVLHNIFHVFQSEIPKDARHIGTQMPLCFINWLTHESTALPRSVLQTVDPHKFLQAAQKFWVASGRPCMIDTHHVPTDLLSMPLPASTSERKRILFRLVGSPMLESRHHHYCRYIEHVTKPFRGQVWGHLLMAPLNPFDKSSDDPLRRYHYTIDKIRLERQAVIQAYQERVVAAYDASYAALRRHGLSEFDANDAHVRRDPEAAWSTAAFSCT
jgi:hypothetical protein